MLINMSQDNLNELNEDLIQFKSFLESLKNGDGISFFGKRLDSQSADKIDSFLTRLNRWV